MTQKTNKRIIIGILIIIIGVITIIAGYLYDLTELYTIGVGGIFLGLLVTTFVRQNYVKSEYSNAVLDSHMELIDKILAHLKIEENGIYIPPKPDLKEGAVFIPAHPNYNLNITDLTDEKVFLTGKKGRDIGLLFTPPGKDLTKVYENYLGYNLKNIENIKELETLSNPLQGMNLAKGIKIYPKKTKEEKESGREEVESSDVLEGSDVVRLRVKGLQLEGDEYGLSSGAYKQVGGPVFSSLILALAKATNKLWKINKYRTEKKYVEVELTNLGDINEWR